MLKIDNNLLIELGLGDLPVEEKNQLLKHIYETLEMRVGMTLAKQMNDEQLTEFEGFIDSNDEAGALRWLEQNFPDYKSVVAAELESMKKEIAADADKIKQAVVQDAAETHKHKSNFTRLPAMNALALMAFFPSGLSSLINKAPLRQ